MHFALVAALALNVGPVSTDVPNRQPQLAVADGKVYLVFGSGHSIWLTDSSDGGTTFSAASKVGELPALALGRHRGPRVVVSGRTIVVSAIGGTKVAEGPHAHGLPADGNLVAWRSVDGGHTWSQPSAVNDAPASAREGLHAMAVDAAGTLTAVWLDLRATGTKLFGSQSRDSGKTWSRNVLLYQSPDGTICECCAPSLVATGKEQFAVMFRNALSGNRDLYVLDWKDGIAGAPGKLGTDSWKLNACPMDGGGIATLNGHLVSAWRRDKSVYLAEPGKAEKAIGEGKDVAISPGAKGIYAAWTSPDGIQVHMPDRPEPLRLSSGGGFPNMTRLPSGNVLIAWEEDGSIRIQVLE